MIQSFDFKKQFSKNITANVIFFIINTVIGFFLVPYFIKNLGISSYALIPLATSITSYVLLVTDSLNISVSRFLTIYLQKQNYKKANIVFNTSLFGILGIVLISIPVILILSYYFIPDFFNIPLNQRSDVTFLFICIMFTFTIRIIGSIFGISLFAYNRLDLQKGIELLNIVIKVVLIIFFFSEFSPKLSYIGLSYLIAAAFTFFMTLYISKKINPHFKINHTDVDMSQLKEISQMSTWIIISQIGALLFLQIDLIVVNKLFGSVAGGEYGIVLMWSRLLRTIAGVLSGALVPIMYMYYANSNFERIIFHSKNSVKFLGFAMALPIGIICGFAPQILSLWVGSEFIHLWFLMWMLVAPLIINLPILPLFAISTSFNKVRIPGLVILFMGVVNFFLALIIPYITGWGYYGVAIAGGIMLTSRNFLFTTWYTAKILGIHKHTYVGSILSGVISMVIIAGVIIMFNRYFNISTIIPMVVVCIMITLVYFSMVWLVGLNESERDILKSLMPFNKGG
jgi:O-antigen/teichoic acid export membrane protein